MERTKKAATAGHLASVGRFPIMDGLSRAHYGDLRATGALVCGGLMGFSMRSGPDGVDGANGVHRSTRSRC